MINITEEKLRAAIQIILGSEGIHTGKLEEDLVFGIKALSICEVSSSLPTGMQKQLEFTEEVYKNGVGNIDADTIEEAFKEGIFLCLQAIESKVKR